eukprot:jgi/Galph1/2933/GphlegSOOS_G1603.1
MSSCSSLRRRAIGGLLDCYSSIDSSFTDNSNPEALSKASHFLNESHALYLKLNSMVNLVQETPSMKDIISLGYSCLKFEERRLRKLLESLGVEAPSTEFDDYCDGPDVAQKASFNGNFLPNPVVPEEYKYRSLDEWEAPTLEQLGLSETSMKALKSFNYTSPTNDNTPPSSIEKYENIRIDAERLGAKAHVSKEREMLINPQEFETSVAAFVKQSITLHELSDMLHRLHLASKNKNSPKFSQQELELIFEVTGSKLKLYCLALVQLKSLRIDGDYLVLVF